MPGDGSIPLLTPLKLIFLPARRGTARAGCGEQRERERERKEIGWKREVEEVENIYLGETLFRGHWAAENLECLVIDGLNINVSRRGSSNDSPNVFYALPFFPIIFLPIILPTKDISVFCLERKWNQVKSFARFYLDSSCILRRISSSFCWNVVRSCVWVPVGTV